MNKIHRLVANISFSCEVGLYVYITTIFLQKEWTKYADIWIYEPFFTKI